MDASTRTADNAAEQRERLLGSPSSAIPVLGCHGEQRGLRARSRNVALSSRSRRLSGAPNVTVHSSGTGMNSPLGITRLRFSIQTGTSSTCGRAPAR